MPIPLALLGLGMGAASALPQWLTGLTQGNTADQLAKDLVRPDFDIPDSAKRALTSAEEQASRNELPGAATIRGQLDQTTANTLATIERLSMDPVMSINSASRAYGNQLEKETDLGIESARMKLRNQDVLRNELGNMADWENQKWMWDERLPYEQRAKAIESLREGSIRNKNAAWKDFIGSGINFGLMDMMDGGSGGDWWNQLFTKQGNNGINPAIPTPAYNDPNSPLFKTDYGSKPLFDKFDLGIPR